jgi:hypothetical protein
MLILRPKKALYFTSCTGSLIWSPVPTFPTTVRLYRGHSLKTPRNISNLQPHHVDKAGSPTRTQPNLHPFQPPARTRINDKPHPYMASTAFSEELAKKSPRLTLVVKLIWKLESSHSVPVVFGHDSRKWFGRRAG